jgi:hypothetical protein
MAGMTTNPGLLTIIAASAAALLLAACGASTGNGPSAGRPDDARQLAFNECMRKAGFDVRETTGPNGRDTAIRIPRGLPKARVGQIQGDCAKKTHGGPRPMSKADQARALDEALKFARCMRSHGVDIPDPQAEGGGIRIGGPGKQNGIDPRSPAFQDAQKACQSLLPRGKGGKFSTGKASPSS